MEYKYDTASPTTSLEAVIITGIIEAKENREVAIFDIPNAFIQTPYEGERVVMKIKGELVPILTGINLLLYEPYVTEEHRQPVMYLEVIKAIYGMLQSALLFYKKLRKDLEDNRFKVNPYDPCVANKTVNGKQLTVTWHVDDLKVSHKDKKIVDAFENWLRANYEDHTPMKPSRGKVHDYLAMEMDYSQPGKLKINMTKYIEGVIENFKYKDKIQTKKVATPAADYLFKVNNNAKKLDYKRAEEFHTTVAKCLFVCKRARMIFRQQ